jgi:hypothetical protein
MSGPPRALLLVAALLALAPAGCDEQGTPITELVLVVTSEFRAPQEVDELVISLSAVDTAGGLPYTRSDTFRLGGNPGEYGMPATLSVRPGGTYTSQVEFTVALRKRKPAPSTEAVTIATRTVTGEFQDGRSISVPVDFLLVDGTACVSDPTAGVAGQPCTSEAQCDGNFCATTSTLGAFPGGYCLGQPNLATACDPLDSTTCAAGSRCVYAGVDRFGTSVTLCMDACSAAGPDGTVNRTNCDCRDGYECDLTTEVCTPGCASDEECCEVWEDLDADGIKDDGEVVPVTGCAGRCDPATVRCVYIPPGGATIGGSCQHDSECPADAYCARRSWVPDPSNGLCALERCDLGERECDAGSGCMNLGSYLQQWDVCVRGCTVGTTPADAGYRCTPGQACWVGDYLDGEAPEELPAADGYCWFGNWSAAPENDLYVSCSANEDCHVPLGIGMCMFDRTGTGGYCSAQGCMNPAVAPLCAKDGGVCGGDVFPYCSPACIPDVVPTASGCPSGFACWDYLGSQFCYLPCTTVADCQPSGACNSISRGCET